jgi:hypothetical protein
MPCHLSSGAPKGSQTGKPGAPAPIRPTATEQGFRATLRLGRAQRVEALVGGAATQVLFQLLVVQWR